MNKKKIAIIGAGRWGRTLVKNLQNIAEIAYIGFNGDDSTRIILQSEFPDIPTTSNMEDIWSDKTISHVWIATPLSTHMKLAADSLRNKKNTLVEKPQVISPNEVSLLYNLAEVNSCYLATGYIYLYDKSLIELSEQIKNCTNVELNLTWNKWGTFDSDINSNLLVHELSIAHYLLGEFEKIISYKASSDSLTTNIKYQNGTAQISINRSSSIKLKKIAAKINNDIFELDSGTLTHKDSGTVLSHHDNSKLISSEGEYFLNQISIINWRRLDSEIAKILEKIKNLS